MRLLEKSVMCACDHGVFAAEESNAAGEITKPRTRIQAPIRVPRGSRVVYTPDLQTKKLKVTVDGVDHELPIDDYSLSLANRE